MDDLKRSMRNKTIVLKGRDEFLFCIPDFVDKKYKTYIYFFMERESSYSLNIFL